jgi:DNA primase catalytic subunit
MKNLIIALVLVLGMTSFAQERKEKPSREEMEKFTPEQRNQLMLKKMTLELDLNAKQQEQVKQVIAEQSTKREAMKAEQKAKQEKPTTDERFAMKNKMLDNQIAMKAKMKTILTAEQLEKWDAMKGKHHQRGGHHGNEGKCGMRK